MTTFAMAAPGWSDDDLPLEYRFGVEAEAAVTHLSDFGADSDVTAFLPTGQPEQDYVLHMIVEVADSLGARATATTDVGFGILLSHHIQLPLTYLESRSTVSRTDVTPGLSRQGSEACET